MSAAEESPRKNPVHEVIRSRRSTRSFQSRPVARERVLELLSLAHSAPSGFNLQPWHFVVVDEPRVLQALSVAALGQRQVGEAPVVVTVLVDRDAWRAPYDEVLETWKRHGVAPAVARRYRFLVSQFFNLGPFGLFGLAKSLAVRILGRFRPLPMLVANRSALESYLAKQAMFAATTFLIAAEADGLATCPMEGFDESRVRRVLSVPSRYRVALLIALGHPKSAHPHTPSIRIPIESRVRFNRFTE